MSLGHFVYFIFCPIRLKEITIYNSNGNPKDDVNEVEVVEDVVVKINKSRIITAPHRWLANGKYDRKPNSPTYFKDYYRAQRQPTECEYCHSIFTGRDCLYKHGKRSNKCIKLRAKLAAEASSSEGSEVSSETGVQTEI